jgi:CRISPR-associated endonuclease/helicase Cas3
VEAFFDSARPHLIELLQAPTVEVTETLIDRAKAVVELPNEAPAAILLTQAREFHAALTVGDLRNANRRKLEFLIRWRILVVSASLGGMNADGLLDGKAAGYGPDASWPGCLDTGWTAEELEQIGICVLGPSEDPQSRNWRPVHRFPWSDPELADPTFLTVATWRKAASSPAMGQAGDLAVQRIAQRLDRHHDWTRIEAARIAQALDLPPAYATMLETAAALHDSGKSRPLWQRAMGAPGDAIYAKTTGGGDLNHLRIDGKVYRHEFGSLADAESVEALTGLSPDLRDLALHLIAAHHGNARPLIAAVDPLIPPSCSRQRGQAAALRFAALQRRWGPWGLAWWEALLRAADRRASKRLDEAAQTGDEG